MKILRNCFTVKHIIVSACWIAGLLFGLYFASKAPLSTMTLFRLIPFSGAHKFHFFLLLLFPLLFSAVLLRFAPASFLYLFVFLDACSLCYCSFCFGFAISGAGWLVCILCLFSALISAATLLYFILRGLRVQNTTFAIDLIVSLTITLVVGCIDYHIISPFLMGLLN